VIFIASIMADQDEDAIFLRESLLRCSRQVADLKSTVFEFWKHATKHKKSVAQKFGCVEKSLHEAANAFVRMHVCEDFDDEIS
jgi:hypothetical protein